MKKNLHPSYHAVIFKDAASDFAVLTRSTRNSPVFGGVWSDGNSYPLIHVEVSSASHPFYTGLQRPIDTAGRVEKFRKKYAKH